MKYAIHGRRVFGIGGVAPGCEQTYAAPAFARASEALSGALRSEPALSVGQDDTVLAFL